MRSVDGGFDCLGGPGHTEVCGGQPEHGGQAGGHHCDGASIGCSVEVLQGDQQGTSVADPGFLELIDEHGQAAAVVIASESSGILQACLDRRSVAGRATAGNLDAHLGPGHAELDLDLVQIVQQGLGALPEGLATPRRAIAPAPAPCRRRRGRWPTRSGSRPHAPHLRLTQQRGLPQSTGAVEGQQRPPGTAERLHPCPPRVDVVELSTAAPRGSQGTIRGSRAKKHSAHRPEVTGTRGELSDAYRNRTASALLYCAVLLSRSPLAARA